jgi:hypothetical protein
MSILEVWLEEKYSLVGTHYTRFRGGNLYMRYINDVDIQGYRYNGSRSAIPTLFLPTVTLGLRPFG